MAMFTKTSTNMIVNKGKKKKDIQLPYSVRRQGAPQSTRLFPYMMCSLSACVCVLCVRMRV